MDETISDMRWNRRSSSICSRRWTDRRGSSRWVAIGSDGKADRVWEGLMW
jgi:hypothetical protein